MKTLLLIIILCVTGWSEIIYDDKGVVLETGYSNEIVGTISNVVGLDVEKGMPSDGWDMYYGQMYDAVKGLKYGCSVAIKSLRILIIVVDLKKDEVISVYDIRRKI